MAKSEQQRQKKLAKKKSKDREKHSQMAREKAQLSSMAGAISAAVGPPSACLVTDGCSDGLGLGRILIARPIPRGQTAIVILLLDMYCLGVKDVVFRLGGPAELRDLIHQLQRSLDASPIRPGECRALVEAAVAYAAGLGLSPHKDYRKVAAIFEGIEALPLPERFVFGKGGKPMYVNGPFEDLARQKKIIQSMVDHVGEGNFNYTLGIGPMLSDSFDPNALESLHFDDEDYEDEDDEDKDFEIEPSQVVDGHVTDRSS